MLAESGQRGVKGAGEVDVLTGFETEWHLGIAVHEERDDWLLVLEGPDPFVLADRIGLTLSAVMTKIMPLQVLIASTICSSQSSPGRRLRLSNQTGIAGGPAASLSASFMSEVLSID